MRITCDRCGQQRMFSETQFGAEQHADLGHHRADASRRLRRQNREGGNWLIVAVAFRLSSSTTVQLEGRHPLSPNLVPEPPGFYAQVSNHG
jgi:hypothetical protein